MAEAVSSHLLDNPAHRHEAGEGWHGAGLNKVVLGAIAFRTALLEQLAYEAFQRGWPTTGTSRLYTSQMEHVKKLKSAFDLENPPEFVPPTVPQEGA